MKEFKVQVLMLIYERSDQLIALAQTTKQKVAHTGNHRSSKEERHANICYLRHKIILA